MIIVSIKEGLSGLFLASEPDHYWNAKNKIMIVGAETRMEHHVRSSVFFRPLHS
jgi:hypothetical protein